MIFGAVISPIAIIAGGVVLLSLTVFQMLVGSRRLHFKGRTHQKVHRYGAWALLGIGVVHGFMGIVYALGLRIG